MVACIHDGANLLTPAVAVPPSPSPAPPEESKHMPCTPPRAVRVPARPRPPAIDAPASITAETRRSAISRSARRQCRSRATSRVARRTPQAPCAQAGAPLHGALSPPLHSAAPLPLPSPLALTSSRGHSASGSVRHASRARVGVSPPALRRRLRRSLSTTTSGLFLDLRSPRAPLARRAAGRGTGRTAPARS